MVLDLLRHRRGTAQNPRLDSKIPRWILRLLTKQITSPRLAKDPPKHRTQEKTPGVDSSVPLTPHQNPSEIWIATLMKKNFP